MIIPAAMPAGIPVSGIFFNIFPDNIPVFSGNASRING
jgi:hypothetical protein